jgi:hypothetical protein
VQSKWLKWLGWAFVAFLALVVLGFVTVGKGSKSIVAPDKNTGAGVPDPDNPGYDKAGNPMGG